MKKIALLTAFFILGLSFGPPCQVALAQKEEQPVVINLKHFTDDLHSAIMALKIASGLKEKGKDVVLFVNLEGVRLADERQPQNLAWGHTPDISALYKEFIANGGKVVVCPHCAAAAGLTTEDLREGAVLADKSQVADLFSEASKVIDY